MPEPEYLLQYMLFYLAEQKDMTGFNVLVTAGPTRESLDLSLIHILMSHCRCSSSVISHAESVTMATSCMIVQAPFHKIKLQGFSLSTSIYFFDYTISPLYTSISYSYPRQCRENHGSFYCPDYCINLVNMS